MFGTFKALVHTRHDENLVPLEGAPTPGTHTRQSCDVSTVARLLRGGVPPPRDATSGFKHLYVVLLDGAVRTAADTTYSNAPTPGEGTIRVHRYLSVAVDARKDD